MWDILTFATCIRVGNIIASDISIASIPTTIHVSLFSRGISNTLDWKDGRRECGVPPGIYALAAWFTFVGDMHRFYRENDRLKPPPHRVRNRAITTKRSTNTKTKKFQLPIRCILFGGFLSPSNKSPRVDFSQHSRPSLWKRPFTSQSTPSFPSSSIRSSNDNPQASVSSS